MNMKVCGVVVFALSACAFARGGVSVTAGPDWIPVHDSTAIAPGSALDFSSFAKSGGEAGRFGRVVARGPHFEFENLPGVKQRFYGVNLCFTANFMSEAKADELCRRLRLTGYNALRIHHYERPLCEGSADGTAINPARMAELDNLMNACIAHGIYLTTDLFVSRAVPYRSCGIDKDGLVEMHEYKELAVFHEGTRSNLVAFTRLLLNHVNPKTGRRWADEPVLAWLSLVNEGNPGNHGWEKTKAWVGLPKGLSDAEMTKRAAAKEMEFVRFMKKELRGLGYKGLITDMNCWHHAEEYQPVRAEYDYVDDHFYVDHPKFLEKSWRLPSETVNRNPLRYNNRGVNWDFFVRLPDKPFTLTEYNFSGPGVYRGIGGILFGAGAALQDMDGIWRFAWSHGAESVLDERRMTYFDVACDPLVRATERAILALFLRGDMPVDRAMKKAVGTSAVLPPDSVKPFACDPTNGAFCVNTPRTAGGFAEAGGSFGCGSLSVTVQGASAAVWATALDEKPLKSSARILLTHVTDLQDSGVVYRDAEMKILEKWGELPHLMRRGTAACRLAADGPRMAYSLNADGTRRFRIPCPYDPDRGEVALALDVGAEPCEATFQYEIVPAPVPTRVLELPHSAENPRNSEGDFAVLKNGDVLFVYSHYTKGKGEDNDPAFLASRVSHDGGRTWSEKSEVVVPNEGSLNVMSVSFLRLKDGSLALFYLRKNSWNDCRPVMRVSRDEGKTWSAARLCVPDSDCDYYVLNNCRVARLRSGRIVLPMCQHATPPGGKIDGAGRLVCYYSDDEGASWTRSACFETYDDTGRRVTTQEPGVIELADGRALMYARTGHGCHWFCWSSDGCATFTKPVPGNLFGPCGPATITRLSTGDLLAVWNDHESVPSLRKDDHGWGKRVPLTLAISRDEGKTWTNRRTLEGNLDDWFCYFSVVEHDGAVLLGYCAKAFLRHARITRVPLAWLYGDDAHTERRLPGKDAPRGFFED